MGGTLSDLLQWWKAKTSSICFGPKLKLSDIVVCISKGLFFTNMWKAASLMNR